MSEPPVGGGELQPCRLRQVGAKAIAPALVAASHFCRGMAELLRNIGLVDLGRGGEAGKQGVSGTLRVPFDLELKSPSLWRNRNPKTMPSISVVSIAKSESEAGPHASCDVVLPSPPALLALSKESNCHAAKARPILRPIRHFELHRGDVRAAAGIMFVRYTRPTMPFSIPAA